MNISMAPCREGVQTEQCYDKERVEDVDDLGAEADLVHWSNALDFDDYTRYAYFQQSICLF